MSMITPNDYKESLQRGIIPTEMTRDALFSVNKRATERCGILREMSFLGNRAKKMLLPDSRYLPP